MEQKKLYVKPEETIVEMNTHLSLLAGSNTGNSGDQEDDDDARFLDFTDTDLDH